MSDPFGRRMEISIKVSMLITQITNNDEYATVDRLYHELQKYDVSLEEMQDVLDNLVRLGTLQCICDAKYEANVYIISANGGHF